MADDIRLDNTFPDHPKTVKLAAALGEPAVRCLLRLWLYTASQRPRGTLTGMTVQDIEIAAKWHGPVGQFVETLASDDIRFLDKLKNGVFRCHNWPKRQPWVIGAPERSAQARKAANKRWAKQDNDLFDAASMPPACAEHADSNAPLLSSPLPSSPSLSSPEKRRRDKKSNGTHPDYQPFIDFWFATYADHFKTKYSSWDVAHGKQLKALIGQHPLEDLKRMVQVYFDTPSAFYHDKGFSFLIFCKDRQGLALKLNNAGGTHDRESEQLARSGGVVAAKGKYDDVVH